MFSVRFRIIFTMLMVAIFIPALFSSSSASRPTSRLLTFRIDENGVVYWNKNRELPTWISPDSTVKIPHNQYLNYGAVYRLISDSLHKDYHFVIGITPHEKSYFMITETIFKIIDRVEHEMNLEKCEKKGIPIDSLTSWDAYRIKYGFMAWRERDNRMLDKVRSESDEIWLTIPPPPEEMTFKYKYDNGYWEYRKEDMIQYSEPEISAPKVGIPTPVIDDKVVDEEED